MYSCSLKIFPGKNNPLELNIVKKHKQGKLEKVCTAIVLPGSGWNTDSYTGLVRLKYQDEVFAHGHGQIQLSAYRSVFECHILLADLA